MSQKKLIRYSGNSFGAVLCPICGDDYTHQLSVEVFERDEDEVVGNHLKIHNNDVKIDRDLSLNPSPRRQGLTIHMRCESDDNFKLHVYQHKGQTIVETEC